MYTEYSRIWACIRGYNGYEYSNDGLLRSMKNYIKYPTGYLVKKYKDKKGEFFNISNNRNERVKLYVIDIINIIRNDSNPIYRSDYETDISSRNKILSGPKIKKKQQDLKSSIGIPKFTIIDKDEKIKINPLIFYL